MIEGLREVQHAVAGDTAPRRLEPDSAACRSGEADRAALRRKHCVSRRLFVVRDERSGTNGVRAEGGVGEA
eukprot:COSAG04_NODE_23033_length_345_cov_0.658537_1_plen_70_part_01